MFNIDDLISGEKFVELSMKIFSVYDTADYYKFPNTFSIENDNECEVVYTHNHYTRKFFEILKDYKKKIILISHNSDNNINKTDIPECVIRWYSQNVNFISEKLESIPIGLENSIWFENIHKKDKLINKQNEIKNHKNLLYINHNIQTNYNERVEPYNLFKNSKWATIEFGRNGYNYDEYIDNIYNHKFVLSPRGNGMDTHRLWETLYLGSIPIEKRNINNQFYTDLPICFVNNWNEITEDFLNNEYKRIVNSNWNLDKLKFEYWRNKIIGKIND